MPEEDLQRFVDAEDIDGLLRHATLDEIAVAWHRYTAAPEPKGDEHPDWWAIELLLRRSAFERPAFYRAMLLKLVEHADEDGLGNVGAGPLENYVSDNEEDLAWLERTCSHVGGLRVALANVWCDCDVSEATMARLDAACGQPLRRIPPPSVEPCAVP